MQNETIKCVQQFQLTSEYFYFLPMDEHFTKKNPDNRDSDIIFYKTIKAGKRIYYLDVKKNRKGELFLAVTESKKIVNDEQSQPVRFEKHKIFLYKEDFDKFQEAFAETLDFIRKNNTVDFVPKKEKEEIMEEEIASAFDLKIDF